LGRKTKSNGVIYYILVGVVLPLPRGNIKNSLHFRGFGISSNQQEDPTCPPENPLSLGKSPEKTTWRTAFIAVGRYPTPRRRTEAGCERFRELAPLIGVGVMLAEIQSRVKNCGFLIRMKPKD